MEVHDPSLQSVTPHRPEDPGGNATEDGVGHVHGVTGASLDLLHPGHDPVEQVDPVAHAQCVSSIALSRPAWLSGGHQVADSNKPAQMCSWKLDSLVTHVLNLPTTSDINVKTEQPSQHIPS